MSNKKKVPFALLTKTGFAAAIVGSSVAAPFLTANAAESDDATDKDVKSSSESKNKDGINVQVNDSALKTAVKKAEDAGVKVTQSPSEEKVVSPKEVDSVKKEIADNYAKQVKDIESKKGNADDNTLAKKEYENKKAVYEREKQKYDDDMKKYQSDKAVYDKAKADFDKKTAQYQKDLEKYQSDKKAYDEAKKKYDADLAQYQKDESDNSKAQEEYKKAKAEYEKKLEEYKTAKAKYDKDLAQYEKDKAAYDTKNKNYQTAKADYDKKLAEYEQAKAKYDADLVQYKKDKAAYSSNKADYEAKKAEYDKAKAQYDKDLKEYETKNKAYIEAINNPQFEGADKTQFSKEQLQKFLGSEPQNVSYINANTASKPMEFDKGNLEEAPDSVKKDWRSSTSIHKRDDGTTDPDYTDGVGYEYTPKENNRDLFYFKKGTTWGYKNVFKDGNTGHDVNVKYTITDIKHKDGSTFEGDYGEVLFNRLAITYFYPIESVTMKVDYTDARTGKPIKIDALNGMGDLDASQTYKLETKMDSVLNGDLVEKKGNQYWEAVDGHVDYKPNNPGTQVWTLAKGVDTQTFTWGTKVDNAQTYRHSIFLENGNIDFGLKLPEKPTPPEEPVAPKEPGDAPVEPKEPTAPTPPEQPGKAPEPPKAPQEPTAPKAPGDAPEPPKAPEEPTAPTPPGEEPVKPTEPKGPGNPPEEPKLETPEVAYKLFNIKVVPTNHKDVENGVTKVDTDKSIHEKEVQVGDVVTYPLTNSELPADRFDEITSYEVNDEVPEGFEPNEAEIKKNIDGKLWNVKVDGQKVTFTATKNLLADMNKDRSKAYKINDLPIVGTITKASDKPLENEFTTAIGKKSVLKDGEGNNNGDGGNKITVTSNKVVNNTPKPVESKVHKYIVENGKLVEKNDAKKGDKLTYQGDIQFSNTTNAKSRTISDQLDKERLDLDDVKVYMAKDDESNTSDKDANNTDSDVSKEDVEANDVEPTTDKDPEVNDNDKSQPDETTKEEPSDKDTEAVDKQQAGEVSNDDETDNKDSDSKEADTTSTEETTLKTGKYVVGKDINAGEYTVKNSDPSDALVVTKDKNGETVTNETIKPDGSKDVELKDGEELSVTAGDKDVTFSPKGNNDTDKDSGVKETDSDDNKDNGKSDDATTKDIDDNASKSAFDVKNAQDVTDQGDLKLDKDNESFTWTAKDPKKFAGKKVTVVIGSTIKKDAKGQIDNVIKLKEDDKSTDSNKVTTTLKEDPKPQEDVPVPPEKEDPKDPEPEQPKQPEQKQEQHQTVTQPKQSQQQKQQAPTPAVQKINPALPSTGSNVKDFSIIGGALVALGAAGAYVLKRRSNNQSTNE